MQVKKETYKADIDASKEASNETSYQELGEINKSETYDSCQSIIIKKNNEK